METMSGRPPSDDDALPIIAIVGATASGKSALALDVAESLGGPASAEIVGADASQLYRGMDIGTAKVPVPERRGIVHHQLDVLDIHDEASVAAYQRDARADISSIRARGKTAILVGGSGLYVRAALDALDIPPTDPQVRAGLEAELEEYGVAHLHARLSGLDPVAAAHIEERNARRIVRALEVIALTGQPFSATMPRRRYRIPTLAVALDVDRSVLDGRIGRRTARMWAEGFVEEVRGLQARGLEHTRTASRAVGYTQALQQLNGELEESEAIEATAAATRRLVRRQESWFRPDPRVHWLPDGSGPEQVLALISR